MSNVARRRGPLATLMVADVISLAGNQMATLAVPWFVLTTTGSVTKTGIVAFFEFLPVAIAGFFGGPLVDRFGLRRMSVISDIASGCTIALIPILHSAGALEFWHLIVLVFLGGLLDSPGETARYSMVPRVADLAGVPVERAASLKDAVSRTSRVLGAPLAGILIGFTGATSVLWIDAATFLISAVLIRVGVPDVKHPPGEDTPAPATYLSDLREGFRFVRTNRVIWLIALTVTVTNLCDAALGSVVVPAYVKELYDDPRVLGFMFGAFSVGAVVGALLWAGLGHRARRAPIFIIGFTLTATRAWFFATVPPVPALIAVSMLLGIGAGPLNPIMASVEFERIPTNLLGRVMGLTNALAWMAMPLGVLGAGFLVSAVGVRAALVIVGSVYVATTVGFSLNPAAKDMERPAAREAPQTA